MYAYGEAYLVLRACERLRIDPAAFGAMSVGLQALYLAFDRIRRMEEQRETTEMVRAGMAAGVARR